MAIDGAVALIYAVTLLAPGVPAGPTWLAVLLASAMSAPLAVRRLWPGAVLVVVTLASVAALSMGVTTDPLLGVAYALYPVATRLPALRPDPTVLVAVIAGVLLLGSSTIGGDGLGQAAGPGRSLPLDQMRWAIVAAVVVGGSWTLGRAVRERRLQTERALRQEAERAAVEERLRLARELHDVVSGTLSVIGVRAAVAHHLGHTRPEEVREALGVIADASREGLEEMRRMLGVLRGECGGADRPLPERLDDLARTARSGGVETSVAVHDVATLPAEQDHAVHRVVQEALTNAVRHAAPTRARVTVARRGAELQVVVDDDGPIGPGASARRTRPDAGGNGIAGMRERVQALGGHLEAGPRDDGGWQVLAGLPCRTPPDRRVR